MGTRSRCCCEIKCINNAVIKKSSTSDLLLKALRRETTADSVVGGEAMTDRPDDASWKRGEGSRGCPSAQRSLPLRSGGGRTPAGWAVLGRAVWRHVPPGSAPEPLREASPGALGGVVLEALRELFPGTLKGAAPDRISA